MGWGLTGHNANQVAEFNHLHICAHVHVYSSGIGSDQSSDESPNAGLDRLDAEDLAARFKLLSDSGRGQIVYALFESGELRVGDIADLVKSSESATSHQLRQLRLAGLVRSTRVGREVRYRIADSHVRVLLDVAVGHYLHDHGNHP